ncbi:hypothetical protein UFOVP162_1 [uncultured Caudovirales phage]|uniref:Uncharacterized protein n=1 Tax=uncultured Caudovirales phage TaxID=2100421 RepID=A0A6J7XM22_9CAUD|nr:hypothetical protein UFOVP162_1 [uncultured Caudovirales phage]
MKEDTTPIDNFTPLSINNGGVCQGPVFARDMTLRDHYAGLAMQGLLASAESGDDIGELPTLCWLVADAMLKAREAK